MDFPWSFPDGNCSARLHRKVCMPVLGLGLGGAVEHWPESIRATAWSRTLLNAIIVAIIVACGSQQQLPMKAHGGPAENRNNETTLQSQGITTDLRSREPCSVQSSRRTLLYAGTALRLSFHRPADPRAGKQIKNKNRRRCPNISLIANDLLRRNLFRAWGQSSPETSLKQVC